MKKQLIGFLFGISLSALLAFKVSTFEPTSSTGEVNKIDGLNVFTDCTPVLPYDSIGTLEISFILDTQYESIRSSFIKKAKKKFPNADGLILNLNKKGLDKCVVIKMK
jgi:hypothetical protein